MHPALDATRAVLPCSTSAAERSTSGPPSTRSSRSVADSLVLGRVYRIESAGRGWPLTAPRGSGAPERVVVCAGAEVRELAPGLQFGGGCHVRATFAVRRHLHGSTLACLQEQSREYGETVYGGPVPGEERYVVGLSGPGNEIPVESG